jgi:hypothetical protein
MLKTVTPATVDDDYDDDNSNNNDYDDGADANGNSTVIEQDLEQDPIIEVATDLPREMSLMTRLPRRASETPAAVTAAGMTSTSSSRQPAQAKATKNVRQPPLLLIVVSASHDIPFIIWRIAR